MGPSRELSGSRREFLRATARGGLLAVLALAAALAARSRGPSGQSCVNQGICGGCAAFPGCGLPAALSAKQARARV
jgi:hypothetical protein